MAARMRNAPVLTRLEVRDLVPQAIAHNFTQVGAVVSLGAGAVSFTHIVKAAEPADSLTLYLYSSPQPSRLYFLAQYLPV